MNISAKKKKAINHHLCGLVECPLRFRRQNLHKFIFQNFAPIFHFWYREINVNVLMVGGARMHYRKNYNPFCGGETHS
jgi:hypothetical protein